MALLPPAVAPSKSGALGDALELTCLKLAQLGATVTLLADSPNILVAWRARVRYPRCSVALANVTDPHSLAYALHGKAAVVVGAPLSEQATEALVSVLSGRVSAESLLGPGPQRRVVVLSSVDVYGDAPAGVLGEADVDADGGGDADDGAAALRKFERALLDEPALGGALSVLRACPLFGDAQLDALLSDALGIEELLDDFVATLRERTGLDVDGGRKAELEAAMAATLPPRDAEMQLTHTDDLAGAAVFAIVDGALDGAYHVASAPATLQSIFDASAARRGWSSLALRPRRRRGRGRAARRLQHREARGGGVRAAVADDGRRAAERGCIVLSKRCAVCYKSERSMSLSESSLMRRRSNTRPRESEMTELGWLAIWLMPSMSAASWASVTDPFFTAPAQSSPAQFRGRRRTACPLPPCRRHRGSPSGTAPP